MLQNYGKTSNPPNFFGNIGFAEVAFSRKWKEKRFSFVLRSTFRNFALQICNEA